MKQINTKAWKANSSLTSLKLIYVIEFHKDGAASIAEVGK
jgi:hypothetical protein